MANLVTGNSGQPRVAVPRPPSNPMAARRPEPDPETAAFALHPEVQRATAAFADAVRERDELRQEVTTLRSQVKILEAHIGELQHTLDSERAMKDRFQRYCVTVQTLIETISRAARQAADAAYDQAVKVEPKQLQPQPQPKPQPATTSEIEQEIAGITKTLRHEQHEATS